MTDTIAGRFERLVGALGEVSQDGDDIHVELRYGYEFDVEGRGGVVELACIGCDDVARTLTTTVRAVQADAGTEITTTATFNAHGETVEVIDGRNHKTAYDYDENCACAGNQKSMQSGNLGIRCCRGGD